MKSATHGSTGRRGATANRVAYGQAHGLALRTTDKGEKSPLYGTGTTGNLDRSSYFRLILLLATIVGLGYAFVRAQSVDFESLAHIRANVETMRQLEQTVDRDTLKIRAGLRAQDDALMQLTDRMAGLLSALRHQVADSAHNLPSGTEDRLDKYGALLKKRKALLQQFKSRNTTVQKSLSAFPVLAANLAQTVGRDRADLADALQAFELSVLRYQNASSDKSISNIGWSVGRLQRLQKAAPPAIAKRIAALLRHGEVIVAHRAEADWTLKELLGISGLKLIDSTLLSMRRNEAALRAESGMYRTVMFALAMILAGYIILNLASLMRVRRDLQRANGQLESRIADISRSKEEAELANRSKSEFLAMMSHELRTPLNAVIGFSDLMRIEAFGPVGSDRYREYAGDIHDSARHLLSLINDILDLSKIERGTLKPEDDDIDIAAAVNAVETLVKDRADRDRVKLKIQLDSDLPPLRADSRQLKQMLANLLANAIKFTDPGGDVTVTVTCDPDAGYVFDVTDNGIGMAPEDLPKALAPFVQVEREHGHKHEGTGLGLPLTKRMIELHGGELILESTQGVGTRAALVFPPDRILSPAGQSSKDAAADTADPLLNDMMEAPPTESERLLPN